MEEIMSPYFDKVYYDYFTGLIRIEIANDKARQTQGIDKVLHLRNGKRIYVDEKVLEVDRGNFVLEEYSNLEADKLGWLEKDVWTDYLAYGYIETKEIFLLPYHLTQHVYKKYKPYWKSEMYQKKPKHLKKAKMYSNSTINPYTTTGFYIKKLDFIKLMAKEMWRTGYDPKKFNK